MGGGAGMSEKREEIDMLYMHCHHDSRYLKYILQDYLRLRDEHEEWIQRTTTALKRCDEIMRNLWNERMAESEVTE